MNLLNEDNVVHVFLNKLGDIVIANLLFILCCIPVITIGSLPRAGTPHS